jgi:general secretion pathway protein G
MTQSNTRRQRGFTLVEIMVVVVILGLLATLVTKSVSGYLADAKETKAKSDVRSIHESVKMWLVKNTTLPERGLEALTEKDQNGHSYLDDLPKDPWGHDYLLRQTGEKAHQFMIVSCGPDGNEDTPDDIRSITETRR